MAAARCPYCSSALDDAFLYVRGIAAALHVSPSPDVSWLSRSGLTQIDLGAVSRTGTGTQAVISALRCTACESISFRTQC